MYKLAAALAIASLALSGCEVPSKDPRGNDRWTATANTNVKIDWDKINKAYQAAEGPEDFERKVNEIYEGDELISVAVLDVDNATQVVTGFFDKDTSGTVEEPEKIFEIRRVIAGDGTGQVQTTGYGHYAGYHSPMLSIMSGMVMGAMLSSAFSPGYRAAYSQPYTTSAARHSELNNQRSQYRAANPGRYSKPKASQTGKSYGGSKRSGGGSRGGGRFGVRRPAGSARPVRLTA